MNTDMTKTHSRLNQYCRFMALLTLIPILILLLGTISPFLYYFFDIPNLGLEFAGFSFFTSGGDYVDPKSLAGWQAAIATLMDTSLILLLVYAFYQLRLLFINYSQSEYFSVKSANHCYIFGKLLVCWVVISFLSEPLLTTILTYNQEESARYFSISFSSDEIITLFLAISIMLIGQILKKACQLAEENKQFI
ncbi:MAG: DUF2975 domain-containing protein [Gilliamella sp.]|jgi:hypothetical protein|uniref:DUF2975 domain-containing protein n=1 Tax=Gilliamella sp. TaxID=1891236 RepID=UPI0026139241|nr:DUF2975 domain-containing protein [Gilliamella sp.]MCO6553357.1 DUF2975 domain-containing protein [Gilliamella sp.]